MFLCVAYKRVGATGGYTAAHGSNLQLRCAWTDQTSPGSHHVPEAVHTVHCYDGHWSPLALLCARACPAINTSSLELQSYSFMQGVESKNVVGISIPRECEPNHASIVTLCVSHNHVTLAHRLMKEIWKGSFCSHHSSRQERVYWDFITGQSSMWAVEARKELRALRRTPRNCAAECGVKMAFGACLCWIVQGLVHHSAQAMSTCSYAAPD
eukprot:2387115-Amphidinium_carterae.1